MTSATTSPSKNLAKFQELLRELFQFDCADLDFGIYRIMNHKRDVIQQFVMDKLPSTVSAELDRGPLAQEANAGADLAKARSELENLAASVEEQAFDEHGALIGRYRTAPASKKYRDALARATEGSRGRDAVEAAIYNHLYTFFGRYYEEGDFISKRRYSRNERYAIPYNGEEVYLHWANSDQYYVKTDEHFRNYDWEAPTGVKVQFRLKNADVEQNNVKGEKRFFIPVSKDTRWNAAETEQNVTGETVIVPFEYRPLTGEEAKRYGNRNQQDSIVAAAASEIPARMTDHPATHLAFTQQYRTDGGGSATRLEHHLRQYVRRNNSDFFIHKDLSSFLNRELDFYLKNEVLNLEVWPEAIGRVLHYAKQTYYRRIRRDSVCNTFQDPIITSVIDAKKITALRRIGVSGQISRDRIQRRGRLGGRVVPATAPDQSHWRADHRLSGPDRKFPENALGKAEIRHGSPVLHHPGHH